MRFIWIKSMCMEIWGERNGPRRTDNGGHTNRWTDINMVQVMWIC